MLELSFTPNDWRSCRLSVMSLIVSDSARSFSLATSLSALEKERVEASVLKSSSS